MKKILSIVALMLMTTVLCFASDDNTKRLKNDGGKLRLSQIRAIPRPANIKAPEKIQFSQEQVRNAIRKAPADGACDVYGFLIYDYRYKTNALIHFDSEKPEDYRMVRDYGRVMAESYYIAAATYVGDELYAYCCLYFAPGGYLPLAWGVIDPETGVFTKKVDVPDGSTTIYNEMTYDPKTNKLFASLFYEYVNNPQDSYTELYTVDPNTFEVSYAARVDHLLYTLSADNGNLYGVARKTDVSLTDPKSAYLVKIPINSINNNTCQVEELNKQSGLGTSIYYAQSMEFDKTNHRLWWMAIDASGTNFFAEIDYNTGKIKSKKIVPDMEIIAMSIPYQYAQDEAPSYPTAFSVKAGANGEKKAILSWKNPAVNYQNQPLSSLTGIKIYRDNVLIHTMATTEIGAQKTWEDTGITESKFYTYKVVPYNAVADGISREVKMFVGRDVPGKVKNLNLTATENTGKLTWTAPATGKYEGWFDTSSLKYKVVRMPDGKEIASGLTATQLEDEVTQTAGYYYIVTAYNNDGEGLPTESNIVSFGPAYNVPYSSTLQTKEEFDEWHKLDANSDGTTWYFDKWKSITQYEYCLNRADDYLITPKINFESGKQYQIRYTYYTINWVEPETMEPVMEKMKVYYGQQPTKEGLSTMLKDLGEFNTPSNMFLYGKDTFTPQPGVGYLAFHACSDPEKGYIYVKDVSVREYSDKDVSVTYLNGNTSVSLGSNQTFVVEVTNEGKSAVSGYKVQIFNADTKEILGETTNTETIAVDGKSNVRVNWVPKKEEKLKISARVILDGDTYPDDNEWNKPIEVLVVSSGGDWLTVNEETEGLSSWFPPLSFVDKYSNIQVIYLDREMQKTNVKLTGIQFRYDTKEYPINYTTPVRISIMNTDKAYFDIDEEYNVHMLDGDWKVVYEGDVNLNAKENETNLALIIPFTNEYDYKGGNIVVKYERLWNDSRLSEDETPLWHLCSIYKEGEPNYNRVAVFRSNYTEEVDLTLVGSLFWTPFTMFSYTDTNGVEGLISLGNEGFSVYQSENVLNFSKTFDAVQLISTSGAVVRSANKVNSLSVSGLKGVYLLKADVDGKTQTIKVTIK